MNKKVTSIKKPGARENKHITNPKPVKEIPLFITAAVFIGITLIFFGDQLFGNSYFWEDFLEYVYPVQTFAAREWINSGIPFWNPYSFAGMPFFADIQVGFFYPLNRILSLFVSGNSLPVVALEFTIILHFLISLLNMYSLGRYWKISSYGSIIAAISYSFSMIMVLHVIHPMIIYHLAWLPLVLMLFVKGLDTRSIKYSIISGLVFGMSFLSGHPQMTLYTALFLGFVYLWYLVSSIKNKELQGRGVVTYIINGILPFIIAVGIFAVQYLPSQELAGMSQRSESTYEKSTEGSLEFKHAYTAVVPKIFGYVDGENQKDPTYYLKFRNNFIKYNYWETAFYFGITALVLGLFGALVHYRNRLGAMWIILALFGMMFALGENGFLYGIFYKLPFFGTFRNPGRMLFMTIMAFSLLAGFGFDSLRQNLKNNLLIYKLLAASAIPLLIAILTATGVLPDALDAPAEIASDIASYGTASLGFITGVIIIAFLLNRDLLATSLAGLLLAAMAFLDLYLAGGSFNKSDVNPAEVYTLSPETKKLMTPNPPSNLYRVNTRMYQPVSVMAMQRNQGMIDRIMLVEGYNPLILNWVLPPVNSREDANKFYNVKYAVEVDMQRGSMYFAQKDSSYPRAWLVHKTHVFDVKTLEKEMRSGKYNFAQEVLLEENPGITLSLTDTSATDEYAKCISYGNNNIVYDINTKTNAIVCFSEIWYPAWKAYIDGKETKILKANYSFRAIPVPAGKHKIEMKYESESYNKGMIASSITLILSVIGLVLASINRKKNTV